MIFFGGWCWWRTRRRRRRIRRAKRQQYINYERCHRCRCHKPYHLPFRTLFVCDGIFRDYTHTHRAPFAIKCYRTRKNDLIKRRIETNCRHLNENACCCHFSTKLYEALWCPKRYTKRSHGKCVSNDVAYGQWQPNCSMFIASEIMKELELITY